MPANSKKASPGSTSSTKRDGEHSGENTPPQRAESNLSTETSKYDPMQQWLDEKPEEASWNSVTYYAKKENSKREGS